MYDERERFRFWKLVNKTDGCWVWLASGNGRGYGKFVTSKRKRLYAHRVSWEIANRQRIPKGMLVCHHCDNPSCVRPEHLFLGTQAENMRDAVSKGTDFGRYMREHPQDAGLCFGEKNGKSRLTVDDVIEIRRLASIGTKQSTIAKAFDVSHGAIWHVVHRWTWDQVPEGEE